MVETETVVDSTLNSNIMCTTVKPLLTQGKILSCKWTNAKEVMRDTCIKEDALLLPFEEIDYDYHVLQGAK